MSLMDSRPPKSGNKSWTLTTLDGAVFAVEEVNFGSGHVVRMIKWCDESEGERIYNPQWLALQLRRLNPAKTEIV